MIETNKVRTAKRGGGVPLGHVATSDGQLDEGCRGRRAGSVGGSAASGVGVWPRRRHCMPAAAPAQTGLDGVAGGGG